MKRAALGIICIFSVALWIGCGGGSSSSSSSGNTNLSHIKKRLFVGNSYGGAIQIIDAQLDQISAFSISPLGTPTDMLVSPDGKYTLVYDKSSNSFDAVNNAQEFLETSGLYVGGFSQSYVLSSDNKTLYAAVRNFQNSTGPQGAIVTVDYSSTKAVTGSIPVPNVRWVAINHAGNRLLAFSDNSDSMAIIDPTQTTPALTTVSAGLDHPVGAIFSSDDSKAYILSCGPECGGTQAMVTEYDMSTGATRSVNVSAATVGLLVSNTLYVAGAPGGVGGTVTAVDTGAMTAGTPVTISSGYHDIMQSAGNKIWIGANTCGGGGCLTVFDPSTSTATVDNPASGSNSKGDVTGMAWVDFQNEMYVIEGGELRVYDTSGNEIPTTMDIVGAAYGIAYVPQ